MRYELRIVVNMTVYADTPEAAENEATGMLHDINDRQTADVVVNSTELTDITECPEEDESEVSITDDEPARDEDYERAAARARANDFEDTDGKDWT